MMDDAIREVFISGETMFRGALIDVDHWQVRLPNGKTALREIVKHRGAAAIVPLDNDGMVTLVRQHRVAIDRMTWEIPAGKLDVHGEDPLVAAKRELEEETGLRAEEWQCLTTTDTTPGFCNEKISIYLATGLSQFEAHTDDDEFLRLRKLPLSDAVALCLNGEITDSKTIVGLMMAHLITRKLFAAQPIDLPLIQRRAGSIPSRTCKE